MSTHAITLLKKLNVKRAGYIVSRATPASLGPEGAACYRTHLDAVVEMAAMTIIAGVLCPA